MPSEFANGDEWDNFMGGVEYAFMSTTSDRDVAVHYAKSSGNGLVFEMWMGMADKGADLGVFSQYPHEREILGTPPSPSLLTTPCCLIWQVPA